MEKIIGPFSQIIPMSGLAPKGPLRDEDLLILTGAGIKVNERGFITAVGPWETFLAEADQKTKIETHAEAMVLLPGLIDAHTHICWGGSRARDYALRLSGMSYQEIAARGGGIRDTVKQTRAASQDELTRLTVGRAQRLMQAGITTIEVKSGYGQSVDSELRMLRAIKKADQQVAADLITTALPAHIIPDEFAGQPTAWIDELNHSFFPIVKQEKLAGRADIFVEDHAYNAALAQRYMELVRSLGLDLTVHADQFSAGGSALAIKYGAVSADHLEASGKKEIAALAKSEVVTTALPGASLGLGIGYTPARALLDAGCCLAIASDWNPGSAPMGDLLTQAALIGIYEKLTIAETLAGITTRAARALRLSDRGRLQAGLRADMVAFPTQDYRDIVYYQGQMRPCRVWKAGQSFSL